MPAAWPDTLPTTYMAESYSEGIADGRLISQTDTGPAKVRPRSSAMPRPLRVSMRMTSAQWHDLREFVEVDLIGGSLPFTMSWEETEELVRFVSLPTRSRLAIGVWNVSIDLEVLP